MSLRAAEIKVLGDAIRQQAFPLGYFCFDRGMPQQAEDRAALEQRVTTLLRSPRLDEVRDGLANVLYWSHIGQPGRQKSKVDKFCTSVTEAQLLAFQQAAAASPPDARQIRDAGLPGFASLASISRVLYFLDPQRCCLVDLPLCRLGRVGGGKALDRIRHSSSIPVTYHNQTAYLDWCVECSQIARNHFPNARPDDVARGFAALQKSHHELIAQAIYQNS